MPSNLPLLSVLFAALLALLFSPSLLSTSHTLSVEILATPVFVRDKALDYNFVRGALIRGGVPFDTMILKRNEHTFGAIHAKRNEMLEVEVPGEGIKRKARVLRNRAGDFAYWEVLGMRVWGFGQEGVLHTVRFVKVEVEGDSGKKMTRLEYEKRWKGSLVAWGLGRSRLLSAAGSGGVRSTEEKGGLQGLRAEIEMAYKEEKERWGSSRYE
ncbi:hypothetical protein CERZMDRAFT_88781 [Cercospora zeae-maydis SCOH1-5]|uniref:Uncharacterized protein n=1 Tax=Cercospora zeae-maydis SCOH1-5 TaxID=717836 RepID=A0A6A6F1P8_9PEZI|nr:hypothetical protein CERZMDRAFT_88781 [Cercospora zeae-maydis SCOH1-5]